MTSAEKIAAVLPFVENALASIDEQLGQARAQRQLARLAGLPLLEVRHLVALRRTYRQILTLARRGPPTAALFRRLDSLNRRGQVQCRRLRPALAGPPGPADGG